MSTGGKFIYTDADELQKAVDNYFLDPPNFRLVTDKNGNETKIPRYTISGFAYSLGFISRQSIYDYIKRDNNLSYIIKRACFFIESEYEAGLRDNNVAGVVFALKNMGWSDRQEHTHSGEITANVFFDKIAEKADKFEDIEQED